MVSRPILARVLPRVTLGALFATIALVQIVGAVHTGSWLLRTHHGLSATLWAMFAVLVVIRPVPIHRSSSRTGVAVALGAQAGAAIVGIAAGGSGSGAVLIAGTVLLACGLVL